MNIAPRWVANVARMGIGASLVYLSVIGVSAAAFEIDPTRSVLGLSGSALTFPLEEQSPGSLTTPFSGAINAIVTDTTIEFSGSSLITAQNNGNWEPKSNGEPGSDPANFGGKASGGFLGTVLAAVRNAQFDVTSLILPITATQFDSRSLQFQFRPNSSGALDYSLSGLFSEKGAIVLAGLATNRVTAQASIATSGNTQTLTIPLAADFYFELLTANDTKLTINGQIVATRLLGPLSPKLNIGLDADGKVAVSWPSSDTGFFLVQSPAVGSTSSWSAVAEFPSLEINRFVVRIKPDAQTRFYGLGTAAQARP